MIKSFPLGQRFLLGYLLRNSDKEEKSAWIDTLGVVSANVTISGMGLSGGEGAVTDEIEIYGANTVDVPKIEGTKIFKVFTKDSVVSIKGYRWIQVRHTIASGSLVTLDYLGSN